MVGDSAGDIEMGRRAGAAGCIGISWGTSGVVAHLEEADVAITQLDEIQVLDS
jgi:phosphoglycolate phosphatase